MPNGTMAGDGSQSNPFVVMDAHDFNALRNVTTTAEDIKHIVLGADIDLGIYPIFNPIPEKHFNIDGKNFLISNISISGGTGLFTHLHTTESKDIRIEGELICSSFSGGAGLFCGQLNLMGNNSKISNIQCYGSITVRFENSTTYAGGCFGRVGAGGGTASIGYVEDCSFYGSISGTTGRSNSSNTQSANGIGGVVGYIDTYSSSYSGHLHVSRCIAKATMVIDATAAVHYMGGIASLAERRSSNLNTATIHKCVADINVRFVNSVATAQFSYVAGILGQTVNETGTVINMCAVHLNIFYDNNLVPPSQLCIAGMVGRAGGSNANVTQSYAVVSLVNKINADLSNATVRFNTQTNINSFFDSTVLSTWFNGTPGNADLGRTTAQLKDQAFLVSQGWVF